MILEILPNKLFSLPNINVLQRNKDSAILHKILHNDLIDKEMYLSSVVMLFVLKGRQIISNSDGHKVVIEQGEMLYLAKDMYLVSDFVTEHNTFEAVLFFMDDTFVEQCAMANQKITHTDSPTNTILTLQPSEQIEKYVHSLISVYTNSKSNHRLLEIKLLELITLINQQEIGPEFLSSFYRFSSPVKKRDIREFMKNNYLKNLKIEDYALLTGRSTSTFMREFKKLYNTTPNQWLIKQRLEKAHQLLINTDFNVTEAAFEVGYENVSHFINAYKNKYGQTPKLSKKSTIDSNGGSMTFFE